MKRFEFIMFTFSAVILGVLLPNIALSADNYQSSITVKGGPNTQLHHIYSDQKQVHLHAQSAYSKGSNSKYNGQEHINIDIRRKKDDGLSKRDRSIADELSVRARKRPIDENKCEEELMEIKMLRRQINGMLNEQARLQIANTELRQKNGLPPNSDSTQKSHVTEIPIVVGEGKSASYSITSTSVDQYSGNYNSATTKSEAQSREEVTGSESEEEVNETQNERKENKEEVAETQGQKKEGKQSSWLVIIFIILLLVPICVAGIFYFLSQTNEDEPEDPNITIIEEHTEPKQFVLADPSQSKRGSQDMTNHDIQRLSSNLAGYFRESQKPVISTNTDNMNESDMPKPVLSTEAEVNNDLRRRSLVDQQLSSDNE